VLFGDADNAALLRAAELERARALVVSFDNERYAQRIVHAARAKRQDLPILVRARDEAALERLLDAGATEGVPETSEASMMLALQAMMFLGLSSGEIFRAMNAARGERYRLLHGLFEREGMRPVAGRIDGDAPYLRTVILPTSAHAIGRRLHELDLVACGIVVTALRHDGRYCAAVPDFVLDAGDELILHGTRDQLDAAERSLLAG
jgi:CPA2 family monovalent cation:H+ antiporter-2